jgi:LytS/YehU family sensor histidine kinase
VFLIAKEVFNLNGNAFLLEFTRYCLSFLETSFLFALSGALMKIALLWYENVMKQKEIEKQLIAGELALLRSQINPRFLFNTLTNIRTFIEQKPDKAIYSIENLSEIMSYMLYETSAEKVFLDDEIDNINNYLNLQRVRYNPDFISFEIKGDTSAVMVPPMLFMPFLEYVFSSRDFPEKTPGIVITINVNGNIVLFEVMNYNKENTDIEKSVNGFSLKSIKRRLDLLFGNNYTLETESDGNKNLLKLIINL